MSRPRELVTSLERFNKFPNLTWDIKMSAAFSGHQEPSSGNAASAVTGQSLPVGNPQEKSKYNCSENKAEVFAIWDV